MARDILPWPAANERRDAGSGLPSRMLNTEMVAVCGSSLYMNLPVTSTTDVSDRTTFARVPAACEISIRWFTTRTASSPRGVEANTAVEGRSAISREIRGSMATSAFLMLPVALFATNKVSFVRLATNRFSSVPAIKDGESAITKGEPGTGESPPSRLTLNPRMTPAAGSAVNKN